MCFLRTRMFSYIATVQLSNEETYRWHNTIIQHSPYSNSVHCSNNTLLANFYPGPGSKPESHTVFSRQPLSILFFQSGAVSQSSFIFPDLSSLEGHRPASLLLSLGSLDVSSSLDSGGDFWEAVLQTHRVFGGRGTQVHTGPARPRTDDVNMDRSV